jgi:hypothetical protein
MAKERKTKKPHAYCENCHCPLLWAYEVKVVTDPKGITHPLCRECRTDFTESEVRPMTPKELAARAKTQTAQQPVAQPAHEYAWLAEWVTQYGVTALAEAIDRLIAERGDDRTVILLTPDKLRRKSCD